jgi:hypothetical protein
LKAILLVLENDSLVLRTKDNVGIWATKSILGAGDSASMHLNVGESLYSPDGSLKLTMENSGLLVLRRVANNTTQWQSGIRADYSGPAGPFPNTYAIMQWDGNLVVYNERPGAASRTHLWGSASQQKDALNNIIELRYRMVLKNDGRMVICKPDGTEVHITN